MNAVDEARVFEFPVYGIVQSRDGFESKAELSTEARHVADDLERAIASDPRRYEQTAIRISRDGARVYEDPGSHLELTFQIDHAQERVLFFRYSERLLPMRKTFFVSYSHDDSVWRDELRGVFQVLENLGEVSFWDDTRLEPGTDWKQVLLETIDSSNAAILLVSDHFLGSRFIREFELPRILAEKKRAVFWIHLSRSRVKERAPAIVRFQSLSSKVDQPLSELLDRDRRLLHDELFKIMAKLAGAINGGSNGAVGATEPDRSEDGAPRSPGVRPDAGRAPGP